MTELKEIYLTGSSEKNRETQDFYPTPPYATKKLLEHERFDGSIWECACGDGAISKVLLEHGYSPSTTHSSDIVDRGYGVHGIDFLKSEYINKYNNVITNPPYSFALEFIEKGLEVATDKVVMLLKLNFLEGQRRYEFFQRSPLKTVYVFSKRLSFDKGDEKGKGSGLLAYAWYVWDEKTYDGKTEIKWLL